MERTLVYQVSGEGKYNRVLENSNRNERTLARIREWLGQPLDNIHGIEIEKLDQVELEELCQLGKALKEGAMRSLTKWENTDVSGEEWEYEEKWNIMQSLLQNCRDFLVLKEYLEAMFESCDLLELELDDWFCQLANPVYEPLYPLLKKKMLEMGDEIGSMLIHGHLP